MRQKVLLICPHFDELDQVYGTRICNNTPFRIQISDEIFVEQSEGMSDIIDDSNEQIGSTNSPPSTKPEDSAQRKSRDKKNANLLLLGQELKEVGLSEAEVNREKIAQKHEHFIQQIELEKRKLDLEKKLLQQQYHLEKEKILSSERLEMMRIKMHAKGD